MAPTLVQSLIRGLEGKDAEVVTQEMACLDILKDLLERFGSEKGVVDFHETLKNKLLKLLEHPKESLRKRTNVTIGPLAPKIADDLFEQTMNLVIDRIQSSAKPETYIQTVGVVCKSAGVRVGHFLPQIIPKLNKYCDMVEEKGQNEECSEKDIELWTNCLVAYESIITRCPGSVGDYVPDVLKHAVRFLSFDPLYADDADDDAEMEDADPDAAGGGGGGGEDGFDEWGEPMQDEGAAAQDNAWGGEEGGSSGAGDDSWKVRLAAVNTISAFIRVKTDMLNQHCTMICEALVKRFRERDSSVREEILFSTKELLHQSVVATDNEDNLEIKQEGNEDELLPMPPQLMRTRSLFNTLALKFDSIVNGIAAQYKSSSARGKKAIFSVFSELLGIVQKEASAYLPKMMPHIVDGLKPSKISDESVMEDALTCLQAVLKHCPLEAIEEGKNSVEELAQAITVAIDQGDQKHRPAALRAAADFARVLATGGAAKNKLAEGLYQSVFAHLKQADVPQEIKVASISTIATILSYFGKAIPNLSNAVFPIFAERLGNEVTRETALTAVTRIANAGVDCSPLVQSSLGEICTFLRKTPASLRHKTAVTLEALVRTNSKAVTAKLYSSLLTEVAAHIDAGDNILSHLVLDLVSTVLEVSPSTAKEVSGDILQRCVRFVNNPLLQGPALRSLIRFFQVAAASGVSPYNNLLNSLLSLAVAGTPKPVLDSLAACAAGITVKADSATIQQTVAKFANDIAGAKLVSHVALLTLGRIGCVTDLSFQVGIENQVYAAFGKDDDVRNAAAFALGNIVVGNMDRFLPMLLDKIQDSKQQYLLLVSLKEILNSFSRDASNEKKEVFAPHVPSVMPLLLNTIVAQDDGTRNMSAECLGRLAVINPPVVLPSIVNLMQDKVPATRAAAAMALRSCFLPNMNWALVHGDAIDSLTNLLSDPDIESVRKQALLSFNALFQTHVETITRNSMKQILPKIYKELKTNQSLVVEIDYGGFKEIVDKHMPTRAAAFQALSTLIHTAPHLLEMGETITQMSTGLADATPDIQIACCQTFSYIATHHGSALLETLDSLPNIIMSNVKVQLKAAKAKDPERSLDCLRATLSALLVFNQIPNVQLQQKYTQFFKQVLATPLLAQMLKEMQGQQPKEAAAPAAAAAE
jgi:hypothetical protein